jgi:hypothetical protein
VPALVAALDVDLDERPGQLLFFPRSSRLARPEANDHVFPPSRLTGMERDILHDPVALVEDSKDRDALGHGRDVRLVRARRRRLLRGNLIRLLGAAAACRQPKRNQQRCGELSHAYSGIQGS